MECIHQRDRRRDVTRPTVVGSDLPKFPKSATCSFLAFPPAGPSFLPALAPCPCLSSALPTKLQCFHFELCKERPKMKMFTTLWPITAFSKVARLVQPCQDCHICVGCTMQYREFEVQPGPHEAFDMPFPLFCLQTNSKALAELLSTAPRDRPHYGPPIARQQTSSYLHLIFVNYAARANPSQR